MNFKLLHEGTDYIKNAKERLKTSPLFSHIADSEKDKYANDIVEELRSAVSALKSNQASKYIQGIIRMVIDTNNWEEAQNILSDTSFLNQVIPYVVKLKSQNKNPSEIKEIDEGIMRKWSFKDFKEWFSPIQKELEKDDVYKPEEIKKSNYDLIPINSYQHFNSLFGGQVTGSSNVSGSPWCHANGKGTYEDWVKKDTNKFFVLAQKGFKQVKELQGDNCPKDEYGLSLMAILVEISTGKLLNCTLRWNHVHTPYNADNQFLTYSEISEIVGFDVKSRVEKNIEEQRKELQNQSLRMNSIVQQKLKNVTTIVGGTLSKREKDLITEIILPNNVKSIENYAFFNCKNLINITIPDSVTSIASDAFEACTNLTNVTIGNGLTFIGNSAFYYCSNLTNITIPNKVEEIGDYAFYYCTRLFNITIPNKVGEIGHSVFRNCSSLTSITIPNNVKSIGNYAFRNCNSLSNIVIPDSVTIIGAGAFQGCDGLTSITIGNGVTIIGDYAFRDCDSLTSITIPDSVTDIGEDAFRNCSELKSITIDNNLIRIDVGAFDNCPNLEKINYKGNTKEWVKIMNNFPQQIDVIFINSQKQESLSLQEKFEQHTTLNPKLWADDSQLKPKITTKLKEILQTYIEDSQFLKSSDILSVEIVGSNASYNYHTKSDIDMHLIVDMGKLSQDEQFAQYANDGEKTIFNKRYDIELYGMSVEIYVQDVNSMTQSNGIYDLLKGKWIKKPEKIVTDIDEDKYDELYKQTEDKAKKILISKDIKEVEEFLDSLYILRRQSLAKDGEAGDYNNIFKDLRTNGLLKKLKDKVIEMKNKELSLKESFDDEIKDLDKKEFIVTAKIYTKDNKWFVKSSDFPYTTDLDTESFNSFTNASNAFRSEIENISNGTEVKYVYKPNGDEEIIVTATIPSITLIKESLNWVIKGTKSVEDSDGFSTDYTWYYSPITKEHIMIFGDSDLYTPDNTEPDWECETEAGAKEWFDNYKGFAAEEYNENYTPNNTPDWRNDMSDTNAHAEEYKDEALAVDNQFADKIVNAMEQYIKEAEKGFITNEQVQKYAKILGIDSAPYEKLNNIWNDIDNVASYYTYGTKDIKHSIALSDALSAFLEIVNYYAREYRSNNSKLSKEDAFRQIGNILYDKTSITTDSDGMEYLSKNAINKIKEISNKAGLTQAELAQYNTKFFGNGGYTITETKQKNDNCNVNKLIEKQFKDIDADDIKDCKKKYESMFDNESNFYTYNDILSGLIDNVDDEEIDKQIVNFNKYARLLKVKPEQMLIYADASNEQHLSYDINIIKQINSEAVLYNIQDTDINFIEEQGPNAISWLYFKTKEDAQEYFNKVEELNY